MANTYEILMKIGGELDSSFSKSAVDAAKSLSGIKVDAGELKSTFEEDVSALTKRAKDIETAFRASASGMNDWSSTSEGLNTRISSLGEKLGVEKEQLGVLREEFVRLQSAEGNNTEALSRVASQMSYAERAIQGTQKDIDKYGAALKETESPMAALDERLSQMGQQIQLSTSKFDITAAAMGNWSEKSEGLRAKLASLSEVVVTQKERVAAMEDVYAQVAAKEGSTSAAAQELAIRLNEEKASLAAVQSDIQKYSADLSEAESKEKEQSSAIGKMKSSFSELGEKAKSTGGGITSMLSGLKGTIAGFAAGIVGSLSMDTIINSTDKAEQTTAQMEAVLKSTGGAAGMTEKQLNDLAMAQAKVTTYSAGTTKEAENMLLTFTNIKGNVFPQTTTAAEDMATAMHTDATSAALTLGKALNDPAQGLSKLTKQGVTFTDSQKKQIDAMEKSGNVAGAQTLMLQELEKEFGGSAKAAGSTLSGQTQIMENNLKSTGVQIATSLMPIAQTVLPMIIDGAQNLAKAIASHKAEIVGAVQGAEKIIKGVFDTVSKIMQKVGPLINPIITDIEKIASRLLPNMSNSMGGLGSKIAGVVAGALTTFKGILDWMASHGEAVRTIVTGLAIGFAAIKIGGGVVKGINGISQAVGKAKDAAGHLKGAFDKIKGAAGAFKAVGSGIASIGSKFGGAIQGAGKLAGSLGKAALGFIKMGAEAAASGAKLAIQKGAELAVAAAEKVAAAVQWLLNAAMDANPIGIIIVLIAAAVAAIVILWNKNAAFRDFIIAAFGVIKNFLLGVWNEIKAAFSVVGDFFAAVFQAAVSGIQAAWNGITGFFRGIWNGIVAVFSAVAGWFSDAFQAAWNGIVTVWNVVTGFFRGIWNGIVGVFNGVDGWFGNIFSGAVNAVQSAWSGITGFFSGIKNGIGGAFSGIGDTIKGAFTAGIDFIKNLPGQMLQWGSDMINGLVSGIKNGIGAITGAVSNIANTIKSFLHFSVPDTGPLKDADTYGPDFIDLIGTGITKNAGKLKGAAKTAATAIANGFNPKLPESNGGGGPTGRTPAPGGFPSIPSGSGAPAGTQPVQVQYAPQIIIKGNASKEDMEKVLDDDRTKFDRLMKEWLHGKRRVSPA